MRRYLHIKLGDRAVESEELHGEAIIRAGRHYIAKTLLERGMVEDGEEVIIVAGVPPGVARSTNVMKLHRIGETVRFS